MTCKEEGCNFVTDAAEDEAHLPLVMKVITKMMTVAMVTVMVMVRMEVVLVRLTLMTALTLMPKCQLQAYELHVSTAHGPPPHLEYVAPPTEGENNEKHRKNCECCPVSQLIVR